MNDIEREKFGINLLETYASLDRSIMKAGGRVPAPDSLQNMTAFQLLCMLAPNRIRFVHLEDAG